MAIPIYEVYNTGTTTYVGFTFLDYYGVTKTIDILGSSSRYYYLACDALTPPTSPSPDIIITTPDNMTGDMYTFSSCCNSQIFGIMGGATFPAADSIGNSYYFEEVITSSNPNEFFDSNCYEWIDVNDSLLLNPTMCTVWSFVGKFPDCSSCLSVYSCCPINYCISNTGVPLYNDNYEDTLLSYDGQHYYTGQTNGLFIYYSSGDTQWCLSDSLGGTCYLSGKSPCSSTCPDLCDELFSSGTCPTPTPTPTNNCSSLDFAVLFDCDLPPTPSVTPTMTVTPTVTVTPTSSSLCPVSFIDAVIFSLEPTPTPTRTPTPTPSIMVERDCTFSGAVTYDMINDDIVCPFSYEFQDCFDQGKKYYTFDTLENPSGGEITQFMVFNATVLVGGTSVPKNRCIHYVGFNNQISGNDHITLLTGPYGFANLGDCIKCNEVNTPTPTPTHTVTPTITVTPTMTNTPSVTPTITPTITLTPSSTSIPSIPCGGELSTNGEVGYYEIITDVGTGTGIGYLNCFAGNIPDRFQVYWNNVLVADSLFVGDYLNVNGTQRTNYVNGILGTTSYNKFIYVGSGGNAPGNNQWNTNGTININFNNNDIAPNTSTRASGSVGNQLNVSPNYLSATDKSCDGDVQLSFNKPSAFPTTIKIIVMGGKSGSGGGTTGWSIKKLICPIPPPAISLSVANCRVQGGCNDNSLCGVRLPVIVSNAPVGYYVSMTVLSSTSASATYFGNNVTYTETTSVGSSVIIKLDLYDTLGGTLLDTTTETITHQSYWNTLPSC